MQNTDRIIPTRNNPSIRWKGTKNVEGRPCVRVYISSPFRITIQIRGAEGKYASVDLTGPEAKAVRDNLHDLFDRVIPDVGDDEPANGLDRNGMRDRRD